MSETVKLNLNSTVSRVVSMDGIQAIFLESNDNSYDVSLSVNSQKFLIRFTDDCWLISDFEIVSFKWFMLNLTNSLVVALKNLVEVLRTRL